MATARPGISEVTKGKEQNTTGRRELDMGQREQQRSMVATLPSGLLGTLD